MNELETTLRYFAETYFGGVVGSEWDEACRALKLDDVGNFQLLRGTVRRQSSGAIFATSGRV